MKSLSVARLGTHRGIRLTSMLSLVAALAWMQVAIGGGFSSTAEPDSPYFSGESVPPSWQGQPLAIPHLSTLTNEPLS